MGLDTSKHSSEAKSGLKEISLGIVVESRDIEDKPYKERYATDQSGDKGTISVMPIEYAVFHTGKISNKAQQSKIDNIKRAFNISSNKKSHIIQAKWLKTDDGPLAFPPMINKGEYVRLYKFADSDTIYWTNMSHEPDLRRHDVFVWAASNINPKKDKGKKYTEREIMNETNSHHWGVDTRNKNIFLKTVKNDGEAAAYDLMFNLKKGIFHLIDTWKNILKTTKELILIQHQGVKVEMKGKVMTIDAKDIVHIIATNKVHVKAPSVVIECDTCRITGDTTIEKNLKVNGNITTDGTVTDVRGDLTNFKTTDKASRA